MIIAAQSRMQIEYYHLSLQRDSRSTTSQRETFCLPDNSTLVKQKDQFIFNHCNRTSTFILWYFTLSDYSRLKEVLIICNGLSTGGMLPKMKITVSVD